MIFEEFVFWSHGVWFYMLMKYNEFLMTFAKIMGIYECSLPRCLFWSGVRDLLIWKMCSFTKLLNFMLFLLNNISLDTSTTKQRHWFYLKKGSLTLFLTPILPFGESNTAQVTGTTDHGRKISHIKKLII